MIQSTVFSVCAQNEFGICKSSGYVEVATQGTLLIVNHKADQCLDTASASHSHLLQQTSVGALPTPMSQGVRRSASITRTTVHTMTFVSRSASMPRDKDESEEPTTPTQASMERSASERPSTPLAVQQQQMPQAPQFIIPLPPQLLVACDARLVLATEVACEPPANFSWFINGEAIRAANASQMHWTQGANQSSLVLEPPIRCETYVVKAQNSNGEAKSETTLVDENSEAAQIRGKRMGSVEAGSRRVENITTIVKTDVEREMIAGDSDSDESAGDTVSLSTYPNSDIHCRFAFTRQQTFHPTSKLKPRPHSQPSTSPSLQAEFMKPLKSKSSWNQSATSLKNPCSFNCLRPNSFNFPKTSRWSFKSACLLIHQQPSDSTTRTSNWKTRQLLKLMTSQSTTLL